MATKKRIEIEQLRPGMLGEPLDRSWLDKPFFRHKMTITSAARIAQLKACGMQTLIVKMGLEAEDAAESEPLPEPNIATEPVLTAV